MRFFNLKSDYVSLADWCHKRKLPAPPPFLLPPTGIIVDNAACGFLIKCDNQMGILEFYYSNPDIPKNQRSDALDEVTQGLIHAAKRTGIKFLKCDSKLKQICDRAVKHGFKSVGQHEALAMEL